MKGFQFGSVPKAPNSKETFFFSLSLLKHSSVEGVSAWSWSEEREQFYLHNFFDFVPDLNLRNDTVREKMKVGEM